jgi:hypothetical protein
VAVHQILRECNHLSLCTAHTFSSVWEQRGECIECAASLRNGSHFQPMAEDHDRDQRCKFPPDFDLKEAECCSERRTKSNCDRQADEGHHAGLVVCKLAPCPTNEDETTVNKDHRSEDWGNQG